MSEKRPVVVLTDYMYESLDPFIKVYERENIEFRAYQCKTAEEIINVCKDADAVQVHFAQITREIMQALPHVRMIAHSGVGMDNFDVEAATELQMPITNVPDYGIEDVATHAILLTMAMAKKLNKLIDTVKRGVWDYAVSKPVHRIQGQTFGMVGCGSIARCAAKKARALGLKVIAYDPYLKPEQVEPLGITLKSLDEVAAESDFVSLHVLLNKSTAGMINMDFFKKMKPTAFLINTARGGLVVEKDLIAALEQNIIAGAGLDVLCSESISTDDPLVKMDNVILTPHAAWYSEEAYLTLLTSTAEEVVRGLKGEPLKYPFNKIPYARKPQ